MNKKSLTQRSGWVRALSAGCAAGEHQSALQNALSRHLLSAHNQLLGRADDHLGIHVCAGVGVAQHDLQRGRVDAA